MSMMTSSTMPTMLSSGNNDGWGGSGALIAILALAFCGGGFGGGWGRGDHGCGDANAEVNGRFNEINSAIDNLGAREDLARGLKETCDVHMDLLETKYDLGNQINQNRFDTAIEFKNAELRAADCCCATNANITAAKQEILDKLSANEIKALEAKINDLQRQIPVGTYITYPSNLPIYPPVSAAGYGGIGGYGFGYGGCGGF